MRQNIARFFVPFIVLVFFVTANAVTVGEFHVSNKMKTKDGKVVDVTVWGDISSGKVKAKVGSVEKDIDCSNTDSFTKAACEGKVADQQINVKCDGRQGDNKDGTGKCEAKMNDKPIGKAECVKGSEGGINCSNEGAGGITKPEEACKSLGKMQSKDGSSVGCSGKNEAPISSGAGCTGAAYADMKVGTMVVTGLDVGKAGDMRTDAKKIDDGKLKEAKEKKSGEKNNYTVGFRCETSGIVGILNMNGHPIFEHTCKQADLKQQDATVVFLQHNESHWSGHCDQKQLQKAVHAVQDDDKWDALKKKDGKPQDIPIRDKAGNQIGTMTAKCDEEGKCTGVIKDKDGKELSRVDFKTNDIESVQKKFDTEGGAVMAAAQKDADEKRRAEEERKKNEGTFRPTQGDVNNAYKQGVQDGQKQAQQQQQPKQQPQQQPQQPQQQQVPQRAVPSPYCAGANAERSEITRGQSVLIRFSMPFAYQFELRGGPGTIQPGGVIVRPTETTTYFIVGTGAPGAGQVSMQQGFGFDQYAAQQQLYMQQQQAGGQCMVGLGQACCGPINITVNAPEQKQPDVIDEEPDNSYKEETPDISCAPESLTRGRSAVVLWKCPDGSQRSMGRAAHTDGSVISSDESFTTDRRLSGKSKKLYPDRNTTYTVYCVNDRGQKSQVASCEVDIVSPAKKQLSKPVAKPTAAKPTPAANQNALRMSITASPMTLQSGTSQEVHVEWKSVNAKTCRVDGPSGFTKENTLNDAVDGTADSPGDLEFVFTCTPKDGGPDQKKSVKVTAT